MGPKLAAKAEKLGVSHGYRYPAEAKENGVISRYFDFEISILPQRRASNPHMPLEFVLKEGSKMTFEKRQDLVDVLGEEKVAGLEKGIATYAKDLEAAGIDFKEVQAVLDAPVADATPKADPDPKPDPEPEGDDLAKRVAAIESTIGTLAEATKEGMEKIATQLKELQRDKDAIIADEMSPRRPAPDPNKRPSQSDATALTEAEEKEARAAIEGGDKTKEPVNPAAIYVDQYIKQPVP